MSEWLHSDIWPAHDTWITRVDEQWPPSVINEVTYLLQRGAENSEIPPQIIEIGPSIAKTGFSETERLLQMAKPGSQLIAIDTNDIVISNLKHKYYSHSFCVSDTW